MPKTKLDIADEILRVLLLILARRRRAEGEKEFDQKIIVADLKKELEIEPATDIETAGRIEQDLVPVSLLQLMLKPNLPAEILELLARLLNNDPQAHQALVKLLTATNTPSNIREALTAVLAKCLEHGYSNAGNVLREALRKSNQPAISSQLTRTIELTSSYAADYLRPRPMPSPFPIVPRPK
jgi:hypothetical protein